jgi:hypothetical protein
MNFNFSSNNTYVTGIKVNILSNEIFLLYTDGTNCIEFEWIQKLSLGKSRAVLQKGEKRDNKKC